MFVMWGTFKQAAAGIAVASEGSGCHCGYDVNVRDRFLSFFA